MFRILFLTLIASPLALAEIYIDYPDGSTYTVKEHERVFVTPADVYMKSSYQDGGVYFQRIHPSTKRDSSYVAPVSEGYQVGSHEWCLNFDTASPYSFETSTWGRLCDGNNDGVYDQADSGWNG
jgi:hypothetical protein